MEALVFGYVDMITDVAVAVELYRGGRVVAACSMIFFTGFSLLLMAVFSLVFKQGS